MRIEENGLCDPCPSRNTHTLDPLRYEEQEMLEHAYEDGASTHVDIGNDVQEDPTVG